MDFSFSKVKIEAIAACVGKTKIDVLSLGKELSVDEKKVSRLLKVNGFETLSVIPSTMGFSDMCIACTEKLKESFDMQLSELDALIVSSQSHDQFIPATSFLLQDKLNLRDDCFLLDNIAGCSSFISSLAQAASLIEAKQCKKILLLSGDVTNRVYSPYCMNNDGFLESGDGCAAILLSYSEEASDIEILTKVYGKLRNVITDESFGNRIIRNPQSCEKPYFYIDGNAFNSFVLDKVSEQVKNYINTKNNISDFDYIFFQPVSKTIISALSMIIGIPQEKAPFLMSSFGNISGAAIPVSLCIQNLITPLKRALLSSFGVGLSSYICNVDLSNTKLLPLVEI